MVVRLRQFKVEEIGVAEHMKQHDDVQALNGQAHFNAQTHSDEFVKGLVVSHDKLAVLVHNLLAAEIWKDKVFPLLIKQLTTNVDSIVSHTLIYDESAIANLMEVILFQPDTCVESDEDALVELADWCYRKLHYLNTDGHKHSQPVERSVQDMMAMSSAQELEERKQEYDFGCAMCSLSILSFLSNNATQLPLGVLGRLVCTNDTIMAITALLQRPCWRRCSKGKMEKYIDPVQKWAYIKPDDMHQLSVYEAQAWLALNALVVEPQCRARYELDDLRRDQLLALRRHLHDALLDQLPPLSDLRRMLDHMALGVSAPSPAQQSRSRLIMEQVPGMREALLHGQDWKALAEQLCTTHLSKNAMQHVARDRCDALAKALEYYLQLEEGKTVQQDVRDRSDTGRRTSPEPLPVMVECSCKVGQGLYEPWCSLQLNIVKDKAAEPVELILDNGTKVNGLRYRLLAPDVDDTRALPCNGRVIVRHGARKAEALLDLPALSLRSRAKELQSMLWVTVGLLAIDGITLQLKLKSMDKPKDRDKVNGVWYAYYPVGGALTLRA